VAASAAPAPVGSDERPLVQTGRRGELGDPLPVVRDTVRALLVASPGYAELDADRRRALAHAMVQVCHVAAGLIREEAESDHDARAAATAESEMRRTAPRGIAQALSAGSEFSGVSAERVAGTTKAILNAVSFPRFVTELINGVFKAMLDSNAQQMNSYVELLNNVAASTEGFADSNVGASRAREWLIEKYPGSYELEGDDPDEAPPATPEERAERQAEQRERTVRMRGNASPPSEQALRVDLGIPEGESVPSGDPERVLVPLVRRRLAKSRQEMLATMVQLGMQRIVIDSGRITASMRFHIDTRSAAQDDRGSRLDFENKLNADVNYGGVGPWGVHASMQNTIGYVSTQKTQTTEEMNTDLDLNSSVELNFKSDYVPLNRMAGPGQAEAIRANSRNPEAEEKLATDERKARGDRNARLDEARNKSLSDGLAPRQTAPLPLVPAPKGVPPVDQDGKAKDDKAKDDKAKDAAAKPPPPAQGDTKVKVGTPPKGDTTAGKLAPAPP
jgi:hypothetical protein